MENMMNGEKKVCSCKHHKIVPVSILLIGLTFLLGQWEILTPSAVATIWPVLLIIIGGTKLGSAKCKCC